MVAVLRGFVQARKAVNQTVELNERSRQLVWILLRSTRPLFGQVESRSLPRDELLYELLVRGISSSSDVHTLRKLFRAVRTDKVPCYVRNLTHRSVEELSKPHTIRPWISRTSSNNRRRSCSNYHLGSERVSST